MTVSIGNGVDIGNLVTSEIDPVTGGIGNIVDTGGGIIPVTGKSKTLVILGSSNGAGLGASTYVSDPSAANGYASPATSWAGLLAADLVAQGWKVINRSVSGTGTVAAVTRFISDVAPHRPSHVIICTHPINDGLDGPLILKNTAILCQMCDMIGAVPILRGAYTSPSLTTAQFAEMLALNQQLDKLGRHRIDHMSTMANGSTGAFVTTGFDMGDGLHHNDSGHLELYREIDQSIFAYGSAVSMNISRSGSWVCDLSNTSSVAIMVGTLTNMQVGLYAWTMRARIKGFVGAVASRAFMACAENEHGSGTPWRVRNGSGYLDIADSNGGVGTSGGISMVDNSTTRDVVFRYNPVTNNLSLWVDGVNTQNGTPSASATIKRCFTFGSWTSSGDYECKGYSFADIALWNVALSDRAIADMYRSNRLQRGGLVFAGDFSSSPLNGGLVPNMVSNGVIGRHGDATWTATAEI